MTPQQYQAEYIRIMRIDSRAAQAAQLNLLNARRDAEQAAEDRANFTATAKAVIAERIAGMNALAQRIVAEPNSEKAIGMAAGFDDEWQSVIVEHILPGEARAIKSIEMNSGTPNKTRVARLNLAQQIADAEVIAKFGGSPRPFIMGAVIDRKYGSGAYMAWRKAVGSSTWWDSKGIPIIQAALLAYVGGSFFQDGGASADAAAATTDAAAAETITVVGVDTGLTTGITVLDEAIAAAATSAIADAMTPNPVAPPPAPQPAQAAPRAGGGGKNDSGMVALLAVCALIGVLA